MKTSALLVAVMLAVFALALPACAKKNSSKLSAGGSYSEEGMASWYGKKFHGKKTASGERFNMYALTAAHRTLPFGSRVKVTSLDNGKSVVVRINDRGPHVKGRIIDLSYAAAKEIGMVRKGVAGVRIELLKTGGGK